MDKLDKQVLSMKSLKVYSWNPNQMHKANKSLLTAYLLNLPDTYKFSEPSEIILERQGTNI